MKTNITVSNHLALDLPYASMPHMLAHGVQQQRTQTLVAIVAGEADLLKGAAKAT
jgi:hypothetical protein